MQVSKLNTRIVIQKNETTIDKIGNHRSAWKDYFSCWAMVISGSLSDTEDLEAGTIKGHEKLNFLVRDTKILAGLDSTQVRILHDGKIYNVYAIDPMGCKKKSLTFQCEKVRR